MRSVWERPRMSTPRAFHEKGCWKMRWPRSPAKKRLSARPAGSDMDAELVLFADRLREQGRNPYVIPGGGSNEIGALGYVNAALELVAQANERSLRIDHLVHATGSCGTQAGLVVGMEAMHSGIPIYGVCVSRGSEEQQDKVYQLVQRTSEYLDLGANFVDRERVITNGDYFGDGYGLPTEGMIEADITGGELRVLRGKETEVIAAHESGKHTEEEMAHFLDCIETGATPLTDGPGSLQGLRVIWRLYEAEENGGLADLRGLGLDQVDEEGHPT